MAPAVRIDKQSCLSSGHCVRSAPESFALDDDHLGDVLPAAGELPRERLLQIARDCPAFAIAVYDEGGTELDLD